MFKIKYTKIIALSFFLVGLSSCSDSEKKQDSNANKADDKKENKSNNPTYKGLNQSYEIVTGTYNQDSCMFYPDGWVLKSDPSKIISGVIYMLDPKTGMKWLEKSIEPGKKEASKGNDGYERYYYEDGKKRSETLISENEKKKVFTSWTKEGIKKYETTTIMQDTATKQIFSWFNAGDPSKIDGSLRSQEFSTVLKSGTFKDSVYVYSDNYISAKKYYKNGLLQGYSYWYDKEGKQIGKAKFNENKFVEGKGTYSFY
ncbi:MAG: hypothetical protein P8I93_00215 [Crocinitomicaceae bacterium]|nr:hypothetical protein [Crocinitomicaceae bacterium]